MNQTVFYETFVYDPITGFKDWVGTADVATIKKHQLAADLSYPLYGEKTVSGWGFKAPRYQDRFCASRVTACVRTAIDRFFPSTNHS